MPLPLPLAPGVFLNSTWDTYHGTLCLLGFVLLLKHKIKPHTLSKLVAVLYFLLLTVDAVLIYTLRAFGSNFSQFQNYKNINYKNLYILTGKVYSTFLISPLSYIFRIPSAEILMSLKFTVL